MVKGFSHTPTPFGPGVIAFSMRVCLSEVITILVILAEKYAGKYRQEDLAVIFKLLTLDARPAVRYA
ncbi:uncharacterized protein Dana_GF28038 [Drosophila ananassae]|uniref:Uncharacterized protein n=1 Tax=Drosophila ananassae TaxID=7217 RepID=A0A0N8NZH0_DROAN|nr:uncharacterized protein Dana_GF28038 [Drosophila ananassae]